MRIYAAFGSCSLWSAPFAPQELCTLFAILNDFGSGWFSASSKRCVSTEFPINCKLYWPLSNINLAAHHRPTRLLVKFVVLVFPCGAAAITYVAGDRDQIAFVRLLPVAALEQLRMAWRAAPVALDAQARFAKGYFLQFVFTPLWRGWCVVIGHIDLLSLLTTGHQTRH